MPGNSLLYSDIDPNVIELLYRRFKTPIEQLIDNKLQRRQLWGPTFKQEDIYECALPDADFRVPEPENGKRTWVFSGTLTATRVIRVPPIVSAWWFVYNKTGQPLTFLIDPAGLVGPTVPANELAAIITDGEEIFGFIGSGASSGSGTGIPGGTATQLQYKLDATTFGGATGSSVSGANIGMGGTLNVTLAPKSILLDPVSQAFPYIQFDRAGADLVHADNTGSIVFRGRRDGGVALQTGYLRSYWSDTFSAGATTEIGSTTGAARIAVTENSSPAGNSATMISGSYFFQVQQGGLKVSGGGDGALFYQNDTFYTPLELGLEGQVLRVTDIGAGVLKPRWGAGGAGATPGLPFNSLQFNNAGSFGGVSASQVIGTTVKLGGILSLNQNGTSDNSRLTSSATGVTAVQVFEKYHDTDPDPMQIDFRRARGSSGSPNAIGTGQGIGKIRFGGWDNGLGDFREYGYLIGQYDATFGGIVRLGALSPASSIDAPGPTRIEIQDSGTGTSSVTLWSGTTWTQWNPAGIRFPYTTAGFLLYTNAGGYLGGIAPTTNGHVLTLVSGAPQWAPPSGTGVNDRLDQILDPLDNTELLMGPHALDLEFTPIAASTPFLIQSGVDNIPYPGALLWVRTTGTSSVMNPFRVTADLNHGFVVTQSGIGVGPAIGMTPAARFHVEGSVRLDLGGDLKGDLPYRSADAGPLTALHTTGASTGWVVTLASTGVPIWQPLPAAGSIRLDQVADPLALADFTMLEYPLTFTWTGVTNGPKFVVETGTGSSGGSGPFALIRTQGSSNLNPLEVYARGNLAFVVDALGEVGVREAAFPWDFNAVGRVRFGAQLANTDREFRFETVIDGTYGPLLQLEMYKYHNRAEPIQVFFSRARGNRGTPTTLVSGDGIGQISFQGFLGSPTAVASQAGLLKCTYNASVGYAMEMQANGTFQFIIDQNGFRWAQSGSPYGGTGSIFYQNSSGYSVPRNPGSNGQVLTLIGGLPDWATPSGIGTVSLDAVGDPGALADFNMNGNQVKFLWSGAVPLGGMLITSTSTEASGGTLLHLKNTYSNDNAARLLVCQIGTSTTYPLIVTHTGQVGIGLLPDVFNFRLYLGPMASDTNTVVISGNVKYDTLGQGTNATGDILYRGSTNLLTRKGIGFAGQYLRVTSGIPEWAYIDFSNDSFNGVLPVAKGGTGLSTPPGAGKLLIGNGTSYGLGNITSGGGLSILYTGGNIQITAVGGSVNDSLNTILAPTANSDLAMGGFQVRFRWDGAVPAAGMLIDSTTTFASQGILLHIKNSYTDDNAARLLLVQRGTGTDYPLFITHIGAVGIGQTPNPGTPTIADTFRLQVAAGASFANGNALYVNGNTRFDITGVALGAIYYRHPTTFNVAGISPAVTAGQVMMSDGSAWAARSITVVGGSVTYTGGVLQLTTPGGTGGTPSGLNQLQWNNAGSFAGVANSVVTTSGLITLQEQSSTLSNALLTLQKAGAGGANIGNGHSIGKILFQGQLSGMQDFGILEALYNTTPLKTLRLGQGVLSAGNAYRVVALKDSGEIGIEVSSGAQTTILKLDTTGIIPTPGNGAVSSNGVYYRDASGGYLVTTLAGSSNQYLKATSGAAPAWDTIDLSTTDVTGTLTLAKGGTGASLSIPGVRLLYSNGSAVTWLNIDSTLSINTGTNTMSAVASAPTGVLRGSKALANNTMTGLMQLAFASSDALACNGWIDLFFVAKRTSPSADVQTHRRIIAFAVSHSRSFVGSYHFKEIALPTTFQSNTETLDKRVTQRVSTDTAALGFSALSQQINSNTVIELGQPEVSNSASFDTFQFKVLAGSPFSLTSLTVFYTITWNGDIAPTIL